MMWTMWTVFPLSTVYARGCDVRVCAHTSDKSDFVHIVHTAKNEVWT